jgi:peptidyl-prolyl cis-trans isomerase C
MNRALLSVFAALFLFCGCDKLPFNKKPVPVAPAAEVKPVVEEKVELKTESKISGALLARVNDWAIGVDDFKSYLNTLKPMAQAQGIDVNNAEFKSRLLNDMVRSQILAQVATERGLDKNADIIKAIKDTKTTLLASKVIADIDKNIVITSAEVQDFYDKNKERLRNPEERRLREAVFASEADAKAANLKIAQDQDFAEIAKVTSISDTKDKGGDLGFVIPGAVKRPLKFWQVAFEQLDKGAVSSVFKGDDGKFYIVKVEDVKASELIPINGEVPLSDGTKVKVDEQLKISLKAEKSDKEVNRLVGDYKARSKVEVKEDLIK